MTEAEALPLGRRWVAAMGDRAWAAGMLGISPGSVRVRCIMPATTDDPPWGCDNAGNEWPMGNEQDISPDLRDPATLGAALGVLRAIRADPMMHARLDDGGWWMAEGAVGLGWGMVCSSEAEALVVAAEAAKERE